MIYYNPGIRVGHNTMTTTALTRNETLSP